MRLKDAAGWNQTDEDWARLLRLEPEGCFGIDVDGSLVSTATVISYGRELAWVGMVLTSPEHRGRGLARRLFAHCLEYADRNGVRWVKLDATDMGQGLYAQHGFDVECTIERWLRPPGPAVEPDGIEAGWSPALDQFAADRSTLLQDLARIGSATVAGSGFAMGRPGSRATYFGPCVSQSSTTAAKLLDWFLARHPGEPVAWDVLPANNDAVTLARSRGFAPARHLIRMVRRGSGVDGPPPVNAPAIYATAGFEYG
jgi:GNAT superfamily N-acetyltransferase